MAKELGETTYSLRGCGTASNTRRSICEPTKPSVRREARLVGISTFIMAAVRIRALTTAPRIKPTSIFLRSARRLNPGRGSTYRRGDSVQTTGTSSMVALLLHGYASGLYSSRRIARASRERNDFVMIVALDPPDFRTISDFRKRHLKALGALFLQVLKLCETAGLVKLGHVALDG